MTYFPESEMMMTTTNIWGGLILKFMVFFVQTTLEALYLYK
jgi:hypothetical protein